jgi:hypothetical protein
LRSKSTPQFRPPAASSGFFLLLTYLFLASIKIAKGLEKAQVDLESNVKPLITLIELIRNGG